jgi:hypothetical protein
MRTTSIPAAPILHGLRGKIKLVYQCLVIGHATPVLGQEGD